MVREPTVTRVACAANDGDVLYLSCIEIFCVGVKVKSGGISSKDWDGAEKGIWRNMKRSLIRQTRGCERCGMCIYI